MAAILTSGLMMGACTDQMDNAVTPSAPDTGDKVAQQLSTPESQMEKLNRGLVALPQSKGIFVSWRLLGTDDARTTFDVMRDGKTIATDLTVSNYSDEDGTTASQYQVVCKVNGKTVETSSEVTPWDKPYMTLALDRPATGALGGEYSPNDCSVGDVDGDGEYEIFVKWDPSNSKDNSQSDKTDNVYIDCYKLNGSKLWRIDLGVNIRAGAHYTQFMVYDFNGDGVAEMMCKTAPGSKDGQGKFVNQAATDEAIKAADNEKDWRTSAGRINGGQEYLTVFNGMTGAAIHTIAYYPNRNALAELSEAEGSFNWDDRKRQEGPWRLRQPWRALSGSRGLSRRPRRSSQRHLQPWLLYLRLHLGCRFRRLAAEAPLAPPFRLAYGVVAHRCRHEGVGQGDGSCSHQRRGQLHDVRQRQSQPLHRRCRR